MPNNFKRKRQSDALDIVTVVIVIAVIIAVYFSPYWAGIIPHPPAPTEQSATPVPVE